jgi:D-serine deaminase-like pyridoxal phosphate-dependent protein
MKALSDIETPALVLDRRRLEKNAATMRSKLQGHAIQLRPHLKTAKSIDVARLALDGLEPRITVATLNEAEYFFSNGISDLLYAVCIAPGKFPRAFGLARSGANLTVILDSLEVAAELAKAAEAEGVCLGVMIEIDSGEHRTGLAPHSETLVAIGQCLSQSDALDFRGVLTHAGHAYGAADQAEIKAIAECERRAVIEAAERLRASGLPVPQLSVGSTPTVVFAESFAGVTEARPGVYLFGDLHQAELGTCKTDDIAVSVLATVISAEEKTRRVIVDAGALALSKDRSTAHGAKDCGYGLVCSVDGRVLVPRVCVDNVHQEHGEMDWPESLVMPSIGSQLRILPNHSCMTAAMYDRYVVVDGPGMEVSSVWGKALGWS